MRRIYISCLLVCLLYCSIITSETILDEAPRNTVEEPSILEQIWEVMDIPEGDSDPYIAFSSSTSNEIKQTIDLLKKGEEEISLKNEYRNLVLVLGMTGAGKSTFTQWVTNNDDKLTAVEIDETGEYLIVNEKISNDTIKSQTIFPDLFVDNQTGTPYYDFPGFSDTRSTANDISTSYFIQKVVKHATKVKIVICVNHPSVTKGVDRQDFMKLLRHLSELIKDIYKFKDSIMLVATKVNNKVRMIKGKPVLTGDDVVINGIRIFLEEVKSNLMENLKSEKVSKENKVFYENALKFIDIFLIKNDSTYKRIRLFRQPTDEGKLDQDPTLVDGKRNIQDTLKDLAFTEKTKKDFGHTISDNSKLVINKLVQEIHIDSLNTIMRLSNDIKNHYTDLSKNEENAIKSLSPNTLNSIDISTKQPKSFIEDIELGSSHIFKLINDIKNLKSLKNLATEVNKTIIDLHINLDNNVIRSIGTQQLYIEFLEEASGKKVNRGNPLAWASHFQDILKSLTEINNNLKETAKDTIHELELAIKSDVVKSASSIIKYFEHREQTIQDVAHLYKEIKKGNDKLLEVSKQKILDPKKCTQILADNLDIGPAKYVLSNITMYGNNLGYLQSIKQSSGSSFICNEGLEKVSAYLDISNRWYQFLSRLYAKLSAYEIQKDIKNCKLLSDEIKQSDVGKLVAQTNLNVFLEKCYYTSYDVEFDTIKDISLDKYKLRNLQGVFQHTLNYELNHECNGNKVTFKAPFIKLSDISLDVCEGKIDLVEVFALDKIFIDDDFNNKADAIQMSVIAPTWDIQGKPKVVLNGEDGKSHLDEKAKNGVGPGSNGDDGKPGLLGKPGGNFFGIAKTYINGERLTIFTNGGKGGPGQNAGDGKDGANGVDPQIDPYDTDKMEYNDCDVVTSFLTSCNGVWKGFPFRMVKASETAIESTTTFTFLTSGFKGGDGGNGGKGGFGGKSGDVSIISINEVQLPNTIVKEGEKGSEGKGGQPGVGGKQRVTTITRKYKNVFQNSFNVDHYYDAFVRNSTGKSGTDGGNENGIDIAEKKLAWVHRDHVVNGFKKYLLENIEGVKELTLQQFYDELDKNQRVNDLYDASGYLNELYVLEAQYAKSKRKNSFLPLYKSLVSRIDDFIEKVKDKTNYHSVLDYVRLAASSRLYNINYELDNYLVIDTEKYFEFVAKHMETYKQALKEVKVSTYREQYKKQFIKNILEADSLIKDTILPEINNIYKKIDSQIELMIKEIIKEQESAENNIKEIRDKQEKLAKEIVIKSTLNTIKFGAEFLKFAGPAGAAAANLIGTTSDIVENTVLDDKHSTIFKSAKDSMDSIEKVYKDEKQSLKDNIAQAKEYIKEEALEKKEQNLKELFDKLQPLEKNLGSSDDDMLHYIDKKFYTKEQLKGLINDLKAEKEKLEKEYQKEKKESDNAKRIKDDEEKVENKIEWAGHLEKVISLTEAGYNLFYTDKNNYEKKINAVGKELSKAFEKINELKKQENKIYNTMIPLRKKFENSLTEISETSKNKTQVALDVTRYHIQSNIIDFKKDMDHLIQTSNSIIKGELMSCIEKLNFAILTTVQLYDRIQDYQDKVKFAEYIAAVNTGGKLTENDDLARQIDDLELLTKSNLVLQEYEKATNAFKQFMFPFAGLYMERYEISTSDKSKNVSVLISNAVQRLEFLRDELVKDATVIKKNAYPVYPDIRFDNTKVNRQQSPFYVWRGDKYKQVFNDLLLGKQISLKADITKGIRKNGIKFKEIGIDFVLINATMQDEFNKLLENFLVDMTHYGDSVYRCDEKYYKITHNPLTMRHSVEKPEGKHYYYFDKTATLIKNNPPMCSPYATWKMRLLDKDDNTENFKALEKYVNMVSELALEGWGQFVDLNIDLCNGNLNKYYEIDESLSNL